MKEKTDLLLINFLSGSNAHALLTKLCGDRERAEDLMRQSHTCLFWVCEYDPDTDMNKIITIIESQGGVAFRKKLGYT